MARSAQETKDVLEKQLHLAAEGVQKPITELQTATGIKDKVAQYWINLLLSMFKEKKKKNPRRTTEDIAEELRKWLKEQPGDKINPLLDIAGMPFPLLISI